MRFPGFDRQPSLSEYLSGRKGFAFPTSELPTESQGFLTRVFKGSQCLGVRRDLSLASFYGYRGQKDYEWPQDFTWEVESRLVYKDSTMDLYDCGIDIRGNPEIIISEPDKKGIRRYVENPKHIPNLSSSATTATLSSRF